jgi:hypothetical protein
MSTKLGQPTSVSNNCEVLRLPFEFCHSVPAGSPPLDLTTQQIIDKAIAGATANSVVFSDGVAPSGLAPQAVVGIELMVLKTGQTVTLDDGTQCSPLCDEQSVLVAPNGGTNPTGLNGGGEAMLGGGDKDLPTLKAITLADTVQIVAGGGMIGCIHVAMCKDKLGAPVAI